MNLVFVFIVSLLYHGQYYSTSIHKQPNGAFTGGDAAQRNPRPRARHCSVFRPECCYPLASLPGSSSATLKRQYLSGFTQTHQAPLVA